jgi:hypothetical protein
MPGRLASTFERFWGPLALASASRGGRVRGHTSPPREKASADTGGTAPLNGDQSRHHHFGSVFSESFGRWVAVLEASGIAASRRLRSTSWLGLTLCCVGCSITPSGDSELPAILRDRTSAADPHASTVQEYDLGAILAHGQTLTHEFELKNDAGRPMRLTGGTAFTPCCSAIGPLPELIPPNGKAKIAVTVKPGYQSGLKRAEFAIETDDKVRPVLGLALQMKLVPAWEVKELEGSGPSLPLGRPGKRVFRIVARRQGAEGLDLPDRVSAGEPLVAAFRTQSSTTINPDGLTEATRDVEVTLPALKSKGIQRREVMFRWPGGHVKPHLVAWEVRPRLRLSPTGLVLRASSQAADRIVTVESDGRPFHIQDVRSAFLASKPPLPSNAATRHTIRVSLAPPASAAGRAFDLVVATDYPDEPVVSMSVLVLANANGGDP